MLEAVPEQVGCDMNGCLINALAFADDLLVIGSTKKGVQLALDRIVESLARFGLELSPTKCAAFSLIPAGKEKKIKIALESQFKIGNEWIPQAGILNKTKYLGIWFGEDGPGCSVRGMTE